MQSEPVCQFCKKLILADKGTYWARGQGGIYARGVYPKTIMCAHWGDCAKVIGRTLASVPPKEGEWWFWGHLPFYKEGGEISDRDRFIYILKSDQYYKIGIAKNVEKRIGELQTGNPVELSLVSATFFKNTSGFEALLHKEFWRYRTRGEWFELPYEQLEKLIEIIERGEFIVENLPLENVAYYDVATRVIWRTEPGFVHSLDIKPYRYEVGYNVVLDRQTCKNEPEVTNSSYSELVSEETKEQSLEGYEVEPCKLD